ncbi:hypothetical protein jhhlp_008488 [Lomentospora prolificans]|uniref:Uncharacterized protein n=1 Tax=Lomentospora prolificans TaxID=41688 RepID=A0A2N3MY66_9PEZI|nr:hypothetical protein jhhlp_008488 [Lomentospora prolificans]
MPRLPPDSRRSGSKRMGCFYHSGTRDWDSLCLIRNKRRQLREALRLPQDMLIAFIRRLRAQCTVAFDIYCVNTTQLQQSLKARQFARIGVSNIVDKAYLGIRRTLRALSRLLQTPDKNPHATLISVFLNTIMETVKEGNRIGQYRERRIPHAVSSYHRPSIDDGPPLIPICCGYGALAPSRWMRRNILQSCTPKFRSRERYEKMEAEAKVKEKKENTIDEPWPNNLKFKLGQKSAEEELRLLLGSTFIGHGALRRMEEVRVDNTLTRSQRSLSRPSM